MFVANGQQFESREAFFKSRQTREPERLAKLLDEGQRTLLEERPSLVTRLRTRLGLGDDPKKRMALYLRLQALHDVKPDLVEQAVKEVWAAAATTARDPGRYFCCSILRRLTELGVICDKEGKSHEPI